MSVKAYFQNCSVAPESSTILPLNAIVCSVQC